MDKENLIQETFDAIMRTNRLSRLAKSPQLSIGEIIQKLSACHGKCNNGDRKRVYFDFCGFYPTSLDSWRGSYSEIAIGFENESFEKAPEYTKLIEQFKKAIGKVYTGYKGGDFLMSRNTPVWVANYGESDNTGIVDVLEKDVEIILVTAYCEY